MRFSIVMTLALIVFGCASQAPPAQPQVQPQAQRDAHLQSLRKTREKLAADIDALEIMLTRLHDEHSDLEGMRDGLRQDLQQVSQAYVSSQLERIDAESKYGAGHPAVRSAQKKEETMYALYQQKLKQLTEADKLVRERDRLAEQLRDARDSLRRLDERIAHLEDDGMT
jgi:predicted  nucleic acid-binding Zn-ribbon protein